MYQPLVSIIVPCCNEEKFIAGLLDSFLEQDYLKEKMELLIVDGMSKDKTREIIEKFKTENGNLKIKVLNNQKKFTSFAFNLGIKESKGEIIILWGGHAKYESYYISKSVKYLKEYEADNVGGILKAVSKKDNLIGNGIAFSLSSFFGAGNSSFRKEAEKPIEVDTVFGGCYKREVFDKIGLFNENLIRSQDMELNMRLKKAGGKIMIFPDIVAFYYPKSNLFDFFKHNFKDGFWAVYPLKFVKIPLKLRHYIPLIFVSILFVFLILHLFGFLLFTFLFQLTFIVYLIFSSWFSFKIARREKDFKYFSVMILVFAVRHFGYGFGSIWGAIKLIKEGALFSKKPV